MRSNFRLCAAVARTVPQAAPGGIGVPTILQGGREGLSFVNLYGRATPLQDRVESLFVAGDFAYEWSSRVNMQAWAGRIQIGYTFAELLWKPTITYSYQTFSGDDPLTSKLERFDPLYFEGAPSSWSTGSKSSMLFINSNVNAHQVSLSIAPTKRATLTLRYAYIDVNKLGSPIQFGQATRVDLTIGVPDPITGATRRHMADDLYLEYIRALSDNAYLTAGFSGSVPGSGANSIVGLRSPVWTGGFVNVVLDF